ncbi:MAG: GNAT family N-acetyltransferase [Mycobacterium sp.]
MTHSGHLLPRYARPTSQDFASLGDPDVIWEDARWWRFTERTDLHEVRYLEVREDGQAVALAPLLITEKPGGLLFYDPPRLAGTAGALAEPELLDPSDQQRWAELTATLPDMDQYPSLALATFGNHHGVVHDPARTVDQRRVVMAALPELLLQAAGELGCRSVALLYIDEPDAADVDESASRAGYTSTLLGAEGVLELADTSWEGYLAGLSKRRRYQTRKELRNYQAAGYRTVVRTGPDAFSEELVALQVAHRAKYGLPGGEDRVRRELYAVRDELGESCVVFTAERDGQIGSFTLYLRTRDALFARTGGTLPDAKGCYFAVDYHETARWAVENGIRRVHYGMAAYEAKVTRGCELRPRWGWFAFQGAQADTYREVLELQSQSIERQLALVGYPAAFIPSRLALA